MKIAELVVLIPCHGLEDFPQDHAGEEADSLLAAWTALWHPVLMAAAGSAPHWFRVDTPPGDIAGRLIVVPSVGQERLPAGFSARCKSDGAVLLRKFKNRGELVMAALSVLEERPDVADDLAADFLALGYCRLQIELLARHMRYVSNVDDVYFEQQAVAAARAAVTGDESGALEGLGNCFACLYEARKYFYPVDVYLLDFTLVADTTLGESLRRELGIGLPANLLLGGSVAEALARQQPATQAALRSALDGGTACLIGGELAERELPLLPREEMLENLTAGLASYQRHLQHRPTIFGRRRFGLSPTLPQVLDRLGFRAAFHCTLDDGVFPLGHQCKTRWEGLDGSLIDALAQVPQDAAQAATYLQFARKLGESMDNDHVATVAFVHWPGLTSYWHDDLRRISRYTPALGKFARVDEYFVETALPPIYSKFKADEYRSPYLTQAVIRRQSDPISRCARLHLAAAHRAAVASLRLLTRLVGGPAARAGAHTQPHCAQANSAGPQPAGLEQATPDDAGAKLRPDELTCALADFAAAVPRRPGTAEPGLLLVNPLSFGRHAGVEWPRSSGLPPVAGAVRGAASAGDLAKAVVDLPAMGFTRVPLAVAEEKPNKRAKPIADELVLRNEHFSVTISPSTGGIQSIHDFQHRGNRLSQRLALRTPGEAPRPGELWRDPDETAVYTAMVADSVSIVSSSPVMGEIVSTGGLVDAEGKRLATFRQSVQLWQGSRVVRLHIEIDPLEPLRSDPWNSYIAARFAWNDATAELYRSVHGARQITNARRIESPEFLDMETDGGTITLLAGGHPYHRRVGDRTIDTLLIVRGETARQFTLGIGIDVAHPHVAAHELLAPPLLLPDHSLPPTVAETGWLFHLDTRSVMATHWEAIDEPAVPNERNAASEAASGEASTGAAGTPPDVIPIRSATALPSTSSWPSGFRVRLFDAAGRGGRVLLRTPWPVGMARQTNFLGETLSELSPDGDKIPINFGPHEWLQIEAWWQ